MKEAYVFLAEGFEEVEALTPVDLLRRAGLPVKTVSITDDHEVKGAHGIPVCADVLLRDTDFKGAAWLILPGGLPGATNLYDCRELRELLKAQYESADGRIAAICASPGVVLGQLGLLKGRKATCYPGFQKYMEGADYQDRRVTVDGKFVLGNGPSSALVWALAIVTAWAGEEKMNSTANAMLLYPNGQETLDNFFG